VANPWSYLLAVAFGEQVVGWWARGAFRELSCPITIKIIILKFSKKMRLHSSRPNSSDPNPTSPQPVHSSAKPKRQPDYHAKGKPKPHNDYDGYKENEDLDWLEKLVHGFSLYKDKQTGLFGDTAEGAERVPKPIHSERPKLQVSESEQNLGKGLTEITKKYAQKNKEEPQMKVVSIPKYTLKTKKPEKENLTPTKLPDHQTHVKAHKISYLPKEPALLSQTAVSNISIPSHLDDFTLWGELFPTTARENCFNKTMVTPQLDQLGDDKKDSGKIIKNQSVEMKRNRKSESCSLISEKQEK
jgi:hypothetical protein